MAFNYVRDEDEYAKLIVEHSKSIAERIDETKQYTTKEIVELCSHSYAAGLVYADTHNPVLRGLASAIQNDAEASKILRINSMIGGFV